MGSGISASRKSAANVTDVTTVRLDDTPAGPAAVCNPQYEVFCSFTKYNLGRSFVNGSLYNLDTSPGKR